MTTTDTRLSQLHWEVMTRKRGSATQGVPPGREHLQWVSNAATLFWNDHDALLVDTFLSEAHTTELADWIESKGSTLRTIYVTHAHPDHFFGLTLLLKRFPHARAIAPENVVQGMHDTITPEMRAHWNKVWPGQVPDVLTVTEVLDAKSFMFGGHEFRIVDTGHTDTDDTTAVHVPSMDLVIAGDAVYNETHPFMLECDRAGRQAWLGGLEIIAALNPRFVVVGHGPLEPDNSPKHIAATQEYIRDFERLNQNTSTPRELYDRMLALYPERINPGSLWGSANKAKSET
jgi:glyoxylase-like metal-dependent hydrolase (beta-lactamase superfamily II)